MQSIVGTFSSYHERETFFFRGKKENQKWDFHDASVSKIRESKGYPINSFQELVEKVADLTLSNTKYDLFYRGQNIDFQDRNNKTIIYPSVCRPDKNSDGKYKRAIRSKLIKERYDFLHRLVRYVDPTNDKLDEFHFSLFQHYDVAVTPLIDITQSLRVAATFALMGSEFGYVYVFGLPYSHGSISHFIDNKMILIKLQNVSPVKAFRPRYQEGYLVGKYPFKTTKEADDNLARRLIGKFKLNNANDRFWNRNFKKMPESVLYPRKDAYKTELNKLKADFLNRNL